MQSRHTFRKGVNSGGVCVGCTMERTFAHLVSALRTVIADEDSQHGCHSSSFVDGAARADSKRCRNTHGFAFARTWCPR